MSRPFTTTAVVSKTTMNRMRASKVYHRETIDDLINRILDENDHYKKKLRIKKTKIGGIKQNAKAVNI